MRRYLVLMIAMFILASCGSTPEEVPDWCYTYDFRAQDYDFSLSQGQWVDGVGLQTVDGDLSFSYEYESFVEPSIIYVTVQRSTATSAVNITTAGIIYGVSSAFSIGIPSGNTDIATASFLPATLGDAGKNINITIDVTSYVVVEELNVISIEVLGNGATPFPENPCSLVTPTATNTSLPTVPPTATDFPTGIPTYTPTNTATPTDTPTVEPTEDLSESILITFSDDDGSYQDYTFDSVGATDPEIQTTTAPHYDLLRTARQCCQDGTGYYFLSEYVDVVLDQPSTVDVLTYVIYYARSSDNGNPAHKYTLYDESDNILAEVQTSWTVLSSWVGVTNYPYISGVSKIRVELLRSGAVIASNAVFWLDDIYIHYIPDVMPTNTPTPVLTYTPSATHTPYGLATNTPYNFQPTVNLTVVTATTTVTPLPSRTPFPQSTSYATQTILEGTPTPSIEEIRENEAEWEILEEEKRSNNVVENLLQDILDAINGQGGEGGSNEGGTEGNGSSGIGGASNWGNAISDALYAIEGLTTNIGTFLNQSVNGTQALINSFLTAPPQTIPGLPQCMTAPLEHDICAIYYILDWTLFAPDTPGIFIIPLLLAIMNTIVIFRVLRYVLKLTNTAEDVTNG